MNKIATIKIDYLKWLAVLSALMVVYSFVWYLHSDKYQAGGNSIKYDISAEIIKRLLITGDIEKIDDYCLEVYDKDFDILGKGYPNVILDQRPLFFLLLATMKSFNDFPVGLYYFVNILFLIASLVLFAFALRPSDLYLFVLIGGLFLSPFLVHYCFIYEPNIFEIFLTSLCLFLYMTQRWFLSFFVIALSVFTHYGNLILLGCLFLYHLINHRKNNFDIILSILGGLTAWLCMEAILFILFKNDQLGLLPHLYMTEFLFQKAGGIYGGWAKSSGFVHYWTHSFIYLPLATVGIFWVRGKLQFSLTLLPVLIYIGHTKFQMQGEYRVLFPIYFLAYCYFLLNYLILKNRSIKIVWISLAILSMTGSICYYYSVAKSLSLKEKVKVSITSDLNNETSSMNREKLYWNLKRFNEINHDAKVLYDIKKISLMEDSNIPSPWGSYRHFMHQLKYKIFSYIFAKQSRFLRPDNSLSGFTIVRKERNLSKKQE